MLNVKFLSSFSVPAEIKWLTGNITVNETNSIYLRCDVSGYPAPVITWKKDGKQIRSGSNMLIPRTTRNDSGTYVCIAENAGVGRVEMETIVTVNCKKIEKKESLNCYFCQCNVC